MAEPIQDHTKFMREAAQKRAKYERSRRRYRQRHPHITKKQIAEGADDEK